MDFSTLPASFSAKILPEKPKTPLETPSGSKKLRCLTMEEETLHSSTQQSPEILGFNSRSESMLSTPKADFIIENVVFKGEKQLLDGNCCGVCGIDFSSKFGLKAYKKKFCLVCGNACCRVCSKRKINGKRVCDLCLLRHRSKNVGFFAKNSDF